MLLLIIAPYLHPNDRFFNFFQLAAHPDHEKHTNQGHGSADEHGQIGGVGGLHQQGADDGAGDAAEGEHQVENGEVFAHIVAAEDLTAQRGEEGADTTVEEDGHHAEQAFQRLRRIRIFGT